MRKKKNILLYILLFVLSISVLVLSTILIVIFCNGWISVPQNNNSRDQVTTIINAQTQKKFESEQNSQFSNPEPRLDIEENYEKAIPAQPDSDYDSQKEELLESQPTIVN